MTRLTVRKMHTNLMPSKVHLSVSFIGPYIMPQPLMNHEGKFLAGATKAAMHIQIRDARTGRLKMMEFEHLTGMNECVQ